MDRGPMTFTSDVSLPKDEKAPIDPHDVPLNSLVAQEQVDVNFISRKNFNNNAYRSNFGSNNPRPFPSNNYGNSNSNSYS